MSARSKKRSARGNRPVIKVDVFSEGCRLPYKKMTARSISRLAAAAADKTGIENAVITVIITDDGFIREMNREYRKKDSPTDVISFANRDCEFPDIESEPEDLGDIFISIETAERQAAEYGVSLKDEIKRLSSTAFSTSPDTITRKAKSRPPSWRARNAKFTNPSPDRAFSGPLF